MSHSTREHIARNRFMVINFGADPPVCLDRGGTDHYRGKTRFGAGLSFSLIEWKASTVDNLRTAQSAGHAADPRKMPERARPKMVFPRCLHRQPVLSY
jgi:hypothetical protein